MSVCALLVVSVLGGALAQDRFVDRDGELESILWDFCSVLDWALGTGSEATMLWAVPWLSTGHEIRMTLSSDLISLTSGDSRALGQPPSPMHTWVWNGTELNQSVVDDLDAGSEDIALRSGESVEVGARYLIFENELKPLVFVSKGG